MDENLRLGEVDRLLDLKYNDSGSDKHNTNGDDGNE